jgi:hypothetical protein
MVVCGLQCPLSDRQALPLPVQAVPRRPDEDRRSGYGQVFGYPLQLKIPLFRRQRVLEGDPGDASPEARVVVLNDGCGKGGQEELVLRLDLKGPLRARCP